MDAALNCRGLALVDFVRFVDFDFVTLTPELSFERRS
jgi:hypothetical protein